MFEGLPEHIVDMTPEYHDEYTLLLKEFAGARADQIFGRDAEFKRSKVRFGFNWPQWGSGYQPGSGLLLIGRAANGEDSGWSLSDRLLWKYGSGSTGTNQADMGTA